jgi:hypothetical protein
MAKSPTPTFRLIATLLKGILPALNNLKGLPLLRIFKKNEPPRKPIKDIVKNISAPILSKFEARFLEILAIATSLPKASISRIKQRAIITPPAKPPPGERWPCKTI